MTYRFVIFVSYGNDSIALLQWAHETELTDVAVVYTDTGWAADGWAERVEKGEALASSYGFVTHRTTSKGFKQLARDKKGFPTQRYQWCSEVLKIAPGREWLEKFDPDKMAVAIVGVRREESQDRADFPEWSAKSGNHGDRVMIAPFASLKEAERNEYILRAGFEVLPHRSRECRCINSNRKDLKRFTANDIAEVKAIEAEIGKTMYRPHRHMGAKGIDEVVRWANSERGKFVPAEPVEDATDLEDAEPEQNLLEDCKDLFGACGA
jgi:hypothetical protein